MGPREQRRRLLARLLSAGRQCVPSRSSCGNCMSSLSTKRRLRLATFDEAATSLIGWFARPGSYQSHPIDHGFRCRYLGLKSLWKVLEIAELLQRWIMRLDLRTQTAKNLGKRAATARPGAQEGSWNASTPPGRTTRERERRTATGSGTNIRMKRPTAASKG